MNILLSPPEQSRARAALASIAEGALGLRAAVEADQLVSPEAEQVTKKLASQLSLVRSLLGEPLVASTVAEAENPLNLLRLLRSAREQLDGWLASYGIAPTRAFHVTDDGIATAEIPGVLREGLHAAQSEALYQEGVSIAFTSDHKSALCASAESLTNLGKLVARALPNAKIRPIADSADAESVHSFTLTAELSQITRLASSPVFVVDIALPLEC